jgi:hypothetical protein
MFPLRLFANRRREIPDLNVQFSDGFVAAGAVSTGFLHRDFARA